MKELKGNVIKIIFIIICLVIIFFMMNFFIRYENMNQEENLKYIDEAVDSIKELESKDVTEVENRINSIDGINAAKGEDMKKLFENYVIMGDSRAEGLIEYEVLNKSSVVAYKGRNTVSARKDIGALTNLYPRKIFITYGMNDIEYFGGNADRFIESYKKIIGDLRLKLPKSKVYVCDILPVQKKAIDKKNIYRKVEEFNKALKEMSDELELTFVETKDILIKNPKLYEQDGIHMKQNFYPLWLKKLLDKSN